MKMVCTHHPRQRLRAWRQGVRRVFSLGRLCTTADDAGSGSAKAEHASPAENMTKGSTRPRRIT